MDDHMTARGFAQLEWFTTGHPTIADIALFPAFALSRDFGIDHDEYTALRQWARRFRALPGFKTMPGIPDYH
jgi:glutathione S-transferase